MLPSPYGYFEKLTESIRLIPTDMFCFQPYDQLLALANTNKQLPDKIGEISAIRSTIIDRIPRVQRVMLTLCLGSCNDVCVSMSDSLAFAFHNKCDSYKKEPRIVLVTSINPKIVGGRLFLNATSATHVYFDTEAAVGTVEFDRLAARGVGQTTSTSKVVHAPKIEPLIISELNNLS